MFILGIDISKAKFDVALMIEEKYKHKVFLNNIKGFSQLLTWLKKHNVDKLHACLEATSTYGEELAAFLFDQGFTVSVVNPAQIKGFIKSTLARNKSDKADSIMIAQFCFKMQPPAWKPTPAHIKQLQVMVRRIDDLLHMTTQESNRLGTASSVIRPSIEESLIFLKKEIKRLRQKIREHIDNHPDLKNNRDLLNSISGIGEATIAQLLAFIGDVSRFKKAKQIAAFVGLNPKHHQSGSSINGKARISKIGHAQLRKALYLPAIVASRHNKLIKEFADNLKKNGKKGKVVICAVMRKLIHIVYGVLKSGIPFDSDYLLNKVF